MGVIRWIGVFAAVLMLQVSPVSAQDPAAQAAALAAQQAKEQGQEPLLKEKAEGAAKEAQTKQQEEAAAADVIYRTQREILHDALVGTYYLVGQLPGGGITYSGKVILLRQGGRMAVVRRIGGEDLQGRAEVRNPESPDPILDVTFDQGYAMNYSIYKDMDGYPVLAGRIRSLDGSLPGYETLFYDTQFKK